MEACIKPSKQVRNHVPMTSPKRVHSILKVLLSITSKLKKYDFSHLKKNQHIYQEKDHQYDSFSRIHSCPARWRFQCFSGLLVILTDLTSRTTTRQLEQLHCPIQVQRWSLTTDPRVKVPVLQNQSVTAGPAQEGASKHPPCTPGSCSNQR